LIKSIRNLISGNRKKLRYLIAGGINTVVGLTAYPFLYVCLSPIGFGYLQVLLISHIVSVTFSFLTNKFYVYRTKKNIMQEYFKFFMFYGVYLIINLILLPIFVNVIRLTPIIAQAFISIVGVVMGYFCYNFIVFKKSEKGM
jgi:putative flippase GtrA